MIDSPPGAPPRPPEVEARLAAALAAKGAGYVPRTHHLEGGRPRFTNRLVLESSPYLLQHAHNPVDWWPWSKEAFEEARRRGVPVLLSVGYATCHWCHVMERESFEDLETARLVNALTVPVKVDREERPDVDAVYMAAVQALTGGGGWPMTVFLNHRGEPFYGGTYFPPADGHGLPSFRSVLGGIAAVWEKDPLRISGAADQISRAVRAALRGTGAPGSDVPGEAALRGAARFFLAILDGRHGGARRAPKFPSQMPARLLLRLARRTGDPALLDAALLTLSRMAAGGLMDQVGGGFHRYSTDETWLVPHFEKMLYDNALLSLAYAEAFQATGRRELGRVARQTLDYLVREMASPEGPFWSATDADSEGVEGKFFVWTEAEIRRVLGADADRFVAFHGVTAEGNFEGANILFVPRPDEEEWEKLAPARAALYSERSRRVPPLRDDKVLCGWNGLAISGLAAGGRILGEPRFTGAAARAAAFLLERMRPGGRLHRVWKDGRATVPAFLEDHAFLAQGLLDLFEATFEPRWLEEAASLAEETERLFADPAGGWFSAASDHEALIAREKPDRDGAEPSGASVAALVALRLAALGRGEGWREIAERALRAHAATLAEQPGALAEMLLAVDFALGPAREVVLVWPRGAPPPAELLEVLRTTWLPARVLCGAEEGPALERLGRAAPLAAGRAVIGSRATAYVCERGACRLPAATPEDLAERLR